uniref:Uncharacterized protein n=1 Tax=Ciona intestinalis TaxID=7719 RepID=H2XYR4_CIOIN
MVNIKGRENTLYNCVKILCLLTNGKIKRIKNMDHLTPT